jgi:hypothetical protein
VFLEQFDDFGVASLLCPLPSSPITAALRINICSVVEKKFYDIGVARPCALCKGVSPDFNLVFTSAPAAINSFTTSLYPLANQQRSSYEELKVKY